MIPIFLHLTSAVFSLWRIKNDTVYSSFSVPDIHIYTRTILAAMASHSKADDLEVVEEKIVKRYKPVSTKSIRIPIKVSVLNVDVDITMCRISCCSKFQIPKSLSAEFQRKAGGVNGGAAIDMLSSSLSSEDFEKIKSLAGLGGKVPRITNCSLHLSGSRRSPSLGPPASE